MSIQIGTTNIVSQLTPSDLNGRIILNSPTSSNLISLTSQTPQTSITLNAFTLLRDNTDFKLQDNGVTFISGNRNSVTTTPPAFFNTLTSSNVATFLNNVDIHGTTSTKQLNLASNLNVVVSTASSAGIDVWRNNTNVFSVNGIGSVSIASNVSVAGSITTSRTLTASNVATNIIQNPTILLKGNTICQGNTQITGDLSVQGSLQYSGRLEISSNLTFNTAYVTSNITTSQLNIDFTGPVTSCNVVSCVLRPNVNSAINAMTIDARGRFGIGTQVPSCLLDVQKNPFINDALLFQIGTVVVNSNSFLGIGTNNPRNHLNINVNIADANRSTIGLSHTGNQRFLSATSNNTEVLRVGADGRVAIGAVNDSFGLFVAPQFTSRIPNINTDQIASASTNINCTSTSFSNVATFNASNIVTQTLTSDNLRATSFTTANFNVTGLAVSSSLTSMSSCNTQFSGDFFVMSKNSSDQLLNPLVEGKLRVQAGAQDGTVSRGLVVIGEKDTSARIHSVSARPFLEFTNGIAMGMSVVLSPTGSLIFGESGNIANPALEIDRTNKVKFYNNSEFNDNGILFTGRVASTTNHIVVGKTTFRNSISEPVLFISNSAGVQRSVGVGTTQPAYTLDVQGSIFGTTSYVKSTLLIGNQVTATDALRINSPTASSGIYIQNPGTGNAFTYEAGTTKTVVNLNGNVGIGTLTPQTPLHVNGVSRFVQDDVTVRLAPQTPTAQAAVGFYQTNSFSGDPWLLQSTADNKLNVIKAASNVITFTPQGNVGIGITTPLYGFHVSSNIDGFFGRNMTVQNIAYASQFTQTSDRSIKINLAPIPDALQKISDITGYTYFRTDLQRKEAGLVAQEVARVLPEVVDTNNNSLMTIAYGNMASLFVEAIKELQARVVSLEEQVSMLASRRIE